jgi:hypothetical protein
MRTGLLFIFFLHDTFFSAGTVRIRQYLTSTMTTTYTPGALSQSLFGSKETALDNTVDELFKNSAGPSQVVLTPAVTNTSQDHSKVDSASSKIDAAQKAREAVSKAKSITEIITEKKKEKKVFIAVSPY